MTISQIYTTSPTDQREPVERAAFDLLEKLHIPRRQDLKKFMLL